MRWPVEPGLILLCGHYEGLDERAFAGIDEELSLGDYVLTGGELAACVVVDAVARLMPGVLGNESSAPNDSFEQGLLEHPHYTRPAQSELGEVPAVLLNGDHGAIQAWRRQQSLANTLKKRPDLLDGATLDKKDRDFLERLGLERPELRDREGAHHARPTSDPPPSGGQVYSRPTCPPSAPATASRSTLKVKEGDKERIQIFEGTVIGRGKDGTRETFRVRRIASGVGVERVFLAHSPNIVKVQVTRRGTTTKARLYYLKGRVRQGRPHRRGPPRRAEAGRSGHGHLLAPAPALTAPAIVRKATYRSDKAKSRLNQGRPLC